MIRSVRVKPGCISCRTCEGICPQIFQVKGTSQVVGSDFQTYEQKILQAEKMCPVNVIAVEKDESSEAFFEKAILQEKKELTHDVVEFRFQTKDFSFLPGQYVSLQMKDDQGNFARCYSLVEASKDHFVLCIKLVETGRGAKALKNLQQGEALEVSPACGHFVLQKGQRKKVFIATGTGLAPMIAMLENTPVDIQKTVIFGVQTEQDLFYEDRLAAFLNTKLFVTVSQATESWQGFRGRVTEYLDQIPQDAEVYICGNPAMLNSVLTMLEEKGHPKNLIFHEEFKDQSGTKAPQKTAFNGNMIIEGIQYLFMAAALSVPFLWYFTDLKWTLWDFSWYTVTILMLIRPLADIFPHPFLKSLIPLRKGLGIFSASVVITNAAFSYILNIQNFLSIYFSSQAWGFSNYGFFGHSAELSGLILLITSNTFSQRFLGIWWKRIQRLSYLYFFAAGIYLFHIGKDMALYSMIVVAVLWIVAEWKKY